jgi:hypothetical protein
MDINKWKKIKKWVTFFSVFIGISIPIICFLLIDEINLLLEPLSKFGVNNRTKYLWNFFIFIISIIIFKKNKYLLIESNINDNFKIILNYFNISILISLILTGLIHMEYKLLHLSFATFFFLSYTGFIFWWGVSNIKLNFKESIFSFFISISIILSTFTFIFTEWGYGPFEIIFILLISIWNIKKY